MPPCARGVMCRFKGVEPGCWFVNQIAQSGFGKFHKSHKNHTTFLYS